MPPARIAFAYGDNRTRRSPGPVGPAHSNVVAAGPVIALPSPPGVKRARRTAKCQVGDGDLLPVRDRLPRADAARRFACAGDVRKAPRRIPARCS